MISTVTLVKRGTSSSTSPTGSSIRRTLYSTTTRTHSHHSLITPTMESGITRHWIQSFHRMTLQPHLFQTSKSTTSHQQRLTNMPRNCIARSYHRSPRVQSNAALLAENNGATEFTSATTTTTVKPTSRTKQPYVQHHAPLFGRYSATRRGPFGSTRHQLAADPPRYRLRDVREESRRPNSQDFDPFVNQPQSSKTSARLLADSTDSTFSGPDAYPTTYWGINSLRMAASQRGSSSTLLRTDARLDHIIETPITLEEAVGVYDAGPGMDVPLESAPPLLGNLGMAKINPEALSKTIPPEMNPYILVDKFEQQFTYSGQWTDPQELEMSLRKIGKAKMMIEGVPTAFIESSANEEDVLAMGIHAVVSPLTRVNRTPWLGLLFDTLEQRDWIRLLDRSVMIRLQRSIFSPSVKHWSDPELVQRARSRVLKLALQKRDAKRIDYAEWRTQTRRFRLQLAAAHAMGNHQLDDRDYVGFMKSCVKGNQFLELELAVQHYMENQHTTSPPNEAIYQMYLKGLAHQGRMDHAQEVVQSMKRKGMSLSAQTFGIMLEGYGRQMDERRMKDILKSMNNVGHLLTVDMYTSMMSNYIRADMLDEAQKVFQQLEQSGLKQDAQSRNVVLQLARLRGRKDAGHSALFRATMETLSGVVPRISSKTGASGDAAVKGGLGKNNLAVHYNHRLKECADAMDTTKFVATFKEMTESGLEPNTTSYNILVNYLSNVGSTNDGFLVLDHMKGTIHGRPNTVTYTTLIQCAVKKSEVELGWALYDEMMRRSIMPTLHTYGTLIRLVGLDPRSRIGREIVKRHFIPGQKHIRFPIKTSVEDQIGLNFAGDLYNQLCNQGLKPSQHIFGELLDLTIRGGFMQLAQHVYLEMINKDVGPNTVIMTTLIKGFAIQRDFESGWKVWRNMVEMNIPRNAITYHHLIRLCERSLPNPIAMAEALEGSTATELSSGEESEQTSNTRKPRRRDQKSSKKSKCTDGSAASETEGVSRESLENTARIPLPIWGEIVDQMHVDRVHWSRVQQFRTKRIDYSVWSPVVKKVGVVRAATAEDSTLSSSKSSGLSSESLLSTGALDGAVRSTEGVEVEQEQQSATTNTSSMAGLDEESDSPMIREIYTGGGDLFVPRRARSPITRVGWDSKGKTVKLDKKRIQDLAMP
ncbi:Pentatricopeptide repeat-containing protein 1, mitochondrial [Linnemannia zychae]|nr:Pentatricopeptide repeat-containing protein 1, mitochondrial [Linnemannia zychae]